jgi:hypothetical protein
MAAVVKAELRHAIVPLLLWDGQAFGTPTCAACGRPVRRADSRRPAALWWHAERERWYGAWAMRRAR